MSQRVAAGGEAKVEPSRSESESEQGDLKSPAADAKPGEPPRGRAKRGRHPVEARTHVR